MEFAFILIAFICGLALKLVGLPPLIGYLIAGFTLNYLGFNSTDALQTIANLGITLMLFTIGLKLNVRDLYKKEVVLSFYDENDKALNSIDNLSDYSCNKQRCKKKNGCSRLKESSKHPMNNRRYKPLGNW